MSLTLEKLSNGSNNIFPDAKVQALSGAGYLLQLEHANAIGMNRSIK